MSKILKDLVKKIQYKTGLKIEEIAESIGYTRVHLSRSMSKAESPELEKLVSEKYKEVLLEDDTKMLHGVPHGTHSSEYVALLREDRLMFADIIKLNLTALLNGQRYLHAEMKAAIKSNAEHRTRGDQEALQKELDKISIYAAEYLGVQNEADSQHHAAGKKDNR